MPDSGITLRHMAPGDLMSVVDIHLAGFPGFFLTCLGRDFLRLLYQAIQADGEGVVLVADVNGSLLGFVAGVTRQAGFYQRLIHKQLWAFGWAALGAALRRPGILPRLARALYRPADAQRDVAEACLMSIAVRPEASGRGLGGQLVQGFNQAMRERGVNRYCLTTDRDHNEHANRFYQQMGFELQRTFVTPEGRAMNEYMLRLDRG